MRKFIIEMLNFLSIAIIVIVTVVAGFVGIAATNLITGLLICMFVFILTSIPLGVFLVLCEIKDNIKSIKDYDEVGK